MYKKSSFTTKDSKKEFCSKMLPVNVPGIGEIHAISRDSDRKIYISSHIAIDRKWFEKNTFYFYKTIHFIFIKKYFFIFIKISIYKKYLFKS